MVPHAATLPSRSSVPQPVAASPGSMPSNSVWDLDGGDAFEDVFWDVEVGIDLLDVILLFKGLQQPQDRRGLVLADRHGLLGLHGDLGVLDGYAGRGDRLPDGFEALGIGRDLDGGAVHLDVICSGFDRAKADFVRVLVADFSRDHALALEHPRDRVALTEASAVLGEDVADRRGRALPVVGHAVDHDRDPDRTVALVAKLFQRLALAGARSTIDGGLDLVGRHVDLACFLHCEPQTEIAVDVAATLLGSDGDLTAGTRERLAALRVDDSLLVLDARPLGMPGHLLSLLLLEHAFGDSSPVHSWPAHWTVVLLPRVPPPRVGQGARSRGGSGACRVSILSQAERGRRCAYRLAGCRRRRAPDPRRPCAD